MERHYFIARLVSSHDHLCRYVLSMGNMMDVPCENQWYRVFQARRIQLNFSFHVVSYNTKSDIRYRLTMIYKIVTDTVIHKIFIGILIYGIFVVFHPRLLEEKI